MRQTYARADCVSKLLLCAQDVEAWLRDDLLEKVQTGPKLKVVRATLEVDLGCRVVFIGVFSQLSAQL